MCAKLGGGFFKWDGEIRKGLRRTTLFCSSSSSSELAISRYKSVETEIGCVHGDRFVGREQLLRQRKADFRGSLAYPPKMNAASSYHEKASATSRGIGAESSRRTLYRDRVGRSWSQMPCRA